MKSLLRVGVVGCGGIAQMMHLPFLAEHTDLFEVVGICDVDEKTLEAVSHRYHVSNAFTEYKRLIEQPIDALLVLNSGIHSDQVIAAARAGRHVFVEKPLAYSLEEATEVKEAIQRAGVRLMVGNMKRYDPAYRYAKTLVSQLQDLRFVQINVWHPDDSAYRTHHHIYPPPMVSRGRPEEDRDRRLAGIVTKGTMGERMEEALGKSAPVETRVAYLMMCGSLIHQVNAIRGILGEPEEVVSTHLWHGVEGIATTFRFPKDVLCTLTWVSLPGLKRYQEQYLFLSPESRISLEFPSPYLRHFPTQLNVQGMEGEAAWDKEVVVSYREAFHEELLHFHHCVSTGTEPETGLDEAIKDTKTMIAMAKAYRRSDAG